MIVSVAPMMDWTDRHCRAFHRTLTRRATLYTEMVTAEAIRHGDRNRLLAFNTVEHPVVLQLGGSDPALLAEAARIGEDYGYDAINLNVGCPSDRVQSGRFGACLMREPGLVAECFSAMQAAVRVPVTIKQRLGVDEQEPEEVLPDFVDTLAQAGCRTFIVHARKAWLKGLSPKQNRDVPPLDYAIVRRLKAARPDLEIHLNGGLETMAQALVEAEGLDGVMFGRAAYHQPELLGSVDRLAYGGSEPDVTGEAAMAAYRPYVAAALAAGTPLFALTRHMLGLFAGRPGARAFRRCMSEDARTHEAGLTLYDAALTRIAASAPISAAA
jgi:tRNA-dihydrouridine synthase A